MDALSFPACSIFFRISISFAKRRSSINLASVDDECLRLNLLLGSSFFFNNNLSSLSIQGRSFTLRALHLGIWSLAAATKRSYQFSSEASASSGTMHASHVVFRSVSLSPDQSARLKLYTTRFVFVLLGTFRSNSKLINLWSVQIISLNLWMCWTLVGLVVRTRSRMFLPLVGKSTNCHK